MTTDSNVTMKNPYRTGSKLYVILNFIADGRPHTLEEITEVAYFFSANLQTLYRRRTSSALRTIRQLPSVVALDYHKTSNTYCLSF